jgi:aminopeptidase-like protein
MSRKAAKSERAANAGRAQRGPTEREGRGAAAAVAEPDEASESDEAGAPGTRAAEDAIRETRIPLRFPVLSEGLDYADSGRAMHAWMTEVFPICRSITGAGLRETLESLQDLIPLDLHEVPSGESAFDWTVPPEWSIREAWIKDPQGRKVVDFRDNNLHVVSYSVPVRAVMPLSELRAHLHSLPEHPAWIPYRTTYYKEDWGFCLADRTLRDLPEGDYEVCIDSSLKPDGSLTYGECVLPGRTSEQILIWAHACHPSLANDNLSGMAVAAHLARHLARLADQGMRLRYTYRFVFAPATIGAITWLDRNQALTPHIRHGLVLTLVGDAGPFTYKRSRRGDAPIDKAMARCLAERNAVAPGGAGGGHTLVDFSPFGYDERQFCSPGFDLPMGCLMRTPHGRFPEYHTSADNLDFVKPESLGESLRLALDALTMLEGDGVFVNLNPHCEPQLGRRGLYQAVGNQPDAGAGLMVLLLVV